MHDVNQKGEARPEPKSGFQFNATGFLSPPHNNSFRKGTGGQTRGTSILVFAGIGRVGRVLIPPRGNPQ